MKKKSKLLCILICFVMILSLTPSISASAGTSNQTVKKYGYNTYKIFIGNYTWTQANALCKRYGGHLATITSRGEQNFINKLNINNRNLWIGGYRSSNGNWKWVTNEKWNYTNWAPGEPNNSSNVISNEKYLAVWPGKWNDLANTNTYEQSGFICEWESLNTPIITSYKKSTKTITGKATAKATVYVVINKKTYKSTTNSKGIFAIKTKGIKSGNEVKIYSQKGTRKSRIKSYIFFIQ